MTLNEFRNQVVAHTEHKLKEQKSIPPNAEFSSASSRLREVKYSTPDGTFGIVCLATLKEAKDKYSYWFTLKNYHKAFMETECTQNAWIVLGCQSVDDILCIPLIDFSDSSWSRYILAGNGWNFHIYRDFTLYIPKYSGSTVKLSKYLLRNFKP